MTKNKTKQNKSPQNSNTTVIYSDMYVISIDFHHNICGKRS